MKHIPLKTVDLEIGGQTIELAYHKQLVEILRHPADPADLAEVRQAVRVLDRLDDTAPDAPALVLEDADYAYLRERVLAARWPVIDRVLLQFVEDVTEVKE